MSVRKKSMNVKNTATIQLVATFAIALDQAIDFIVMETLVKVNQFNTVITTNPKNNICYFTDVNECAEGIDDCAQICTDTDGSYVCSCAPGYLLTNDNRGCDGMSALLHCVSNIIEQQLFFVCVYRH